MVQIFSGENTYDSWRAAKLRANELAAKEADCQVLTMDADDLASADILWQQLDTIGMFAESKVVIAKRLFNNSALVAALTKRMEKNADLRLIIWHDGNVDKRTSLVKKISDRGGLSEFAQPKHPDLVNWVKSEFKARNLTPDVNVINVLIERTGTDKWLIENEVNKLALWLEANPGQVLTPELVAEVVGSNGTGDVWKFLDSIALGDKASAISEMEKMLYAEDNVQYLLSMLGRELALIAQVLTSTEVNSGMSLLKMHPFVLEKAKRKARRFTWQKLAKLSQGLLRLDLAIKQGRVDEQTGLFLYLLQW